MNVLRISRRALRRGIIWTCGTLIVLASLWGLYRLGVTVTPPFADQPVIYAPAVRRTEHYRREVAAWLVQLQELDSQMVALLTTPNLDVYTLSQRAQQALEHAATVDQSIALSSPPASLVSLRDGVQETAELHLEAAALLNRWVGEPTEALYLETLDVIRLARATRSAVAANPWLARDVENTATSVPLPAGATTSPVNTPIPQWGGE